jgi:hypothetical protein
MKWENRSLINRGIPTVLYLIIISEITLNIIRTRQVDQVRNEINIGEKIIQDINRSDPSVSRENLDAIKNNLSRLQMQFDAFTQTLLGGTTTLQLIPAHYTQSQDLYFDIIAFIENYTKRASELNIEINEGEKFGFNAIERSGKGPEESNLELVYKQRVIIAHLLAKLFLARPQNFLAVYREPIFPHASNYQRVLGDPSMNDFFIIHPSISAKIPNAIETVGFQFVFTGQTRSLRSFLKQLESFDLPIVVRSVDVKLIEEREERSSAKFFPNQNNKKQGVGYDNQSLPIIKSNLSEFTVTVEYIDLQRIVTKANS